MPTDARSEVPRCAFCGGACATSLADLGAMPLANAYLTAAQLDRAEPTFPLHARVCSACGLVQIVPAQAPREIFRDYAYYSSFAETWLRHAEGFVAAMTHRLALGQASRVVEIASNDGYLLRHVVARGIPCLGIEPAEGPAAAAQAMGIKTIVRFFDEALADTLVADGWAADLAIANNVLAHVPDLRGFVNGLKLLLKPDGIVSIEVPHLLQLIDKVAFDTIYHEHIYHFSFVTLEQVLAAAGLRVIDVERLATHGGSLRVLACRGDATWTDSGAAQRLRDAELAAGIMGRGPYDGFASRVDAVRREFTRFVARVGGCGETIVGYGAAAKGTTFLNACGVGPGDIAFVVDRNPNKQGLFLPGCRLAIRPVEAVAETRPDYLLILPWNLVDEIEQQMSYIRRWGGRFVTAIPKLRIW